MCTLILLCPGGTFALTAQKICSKLSRQRSHIQTPALLHV